MPKMYRWLQLSGIFLVSLFLFTWGVNGQEVIGFESRFYLFALEMWRHGVSWFPTTYQKPYPDYPVTSTLLIYLTGKSLGAMSKLAAVLPSAIAAAITVCLTYLIAELRNKWWGWYSVLFLLFTLTFFKIARLIALDMYPTMITTWCFFLVYNADQKNKIEYLGWVYFLFFLGFAFRGPIGLIIPTGVVCVYHLLSRNYRRMFFSGAFALLILIVSMLVLLGIADSVGGHAFVQQVLWMEVIGRIDNSHLPYYYYFLDCFGSYAISYPLAAIVSLGALYYAWRLRVYPSDLKLLYKLIGWVLVILIGMSFPGDKKIRYVLAISPALALIAAYPFIAPPGEKYFVRMRWLVTRFLLIIPLIFLLGLSYLQAYAKAHSINFAINYSASSTVLSLLLSLSALLFYRYKKKEKWFNFNVVAIATVSFVWIYLFVVEPVDQYLDRTREFVTLVESQRAQQQAQLIFYKENSDGMPIKYFINLSQPVNATFFATEYQLISFPFPAFFVTKESTYTTLPADVAAHFRVIGRDTIGHIPVVVFSNR